jgi:hypothetical protein
MEYNVLVSSATFFRTLVLWESSIYAVMTCCYTKKKKDIKNGNGDGKFVHDVLPRTYGMELERPPSTAQFCPLT